MATRAAFVDGLLKYSKSLRVLSTSLDGPGAMNRRTEVCNLQTDLSIEYIIKRQRKKTYLRKHDNKPNNGVQTCDLQTELIPERDTFATTATKHMMACTDVGSKNHS